MQANQATNDCQADPKAALRAIQALLLLGEQVEDSRQYLGGQPYAAVADPQDDLVAD